MFSKTEEGQQFLIILKMKFVTLNIKTKRYYRKNRVDRVCHAYFCFFDIFKCLFHCLYLMRYLSEFFSAYFDNDKCYKSQNCLIVIIVGDEVQCGY